MAQSSNASGVASNDDGNVVVQEQWYYPAEIANDLEGVALPSRVKEEIFATAWEYSRSVITQYTN